ncbi:MULTISPECIES: pilin [unclassified Pseudoxanthomonas]|uniref:pilin n=1 Tax=unclassified Pseudoxanthomonas TaxID=2645906 RepID=UPI0030778999
MTQWYYAGRDRQRLGPVSAEELVAHYRYSRIALDTLVWREGLEQWQRLGDFADELGLLAATESQVVTPPLPPPPPIAGAPSISSSTASRPQGMSRGKILLIVAAVMVLPCLGIVGILAAIAIPAYNDYTLRAKLTEAVATASPLKTSVAEHYATAGTCPSNDADGFGAAESYAGRYVSQATIGEFDDGTCGIELGVENTGNVNLDGKKIWFEYDPEAASWVCSSEIEDRYLPVDCRG